MKNIKYLSVGTAVYLFIFLADYIYELFQIHSSGTVETILGLKIVTQITETELNSLFSITPKAFVIYLVFVLMWVVLSNIVSNVRK